jgi:hypothetical protein
VRNRDARSIPGFRIGIHELSLICFNSLSQCPLCPAFTKTNLEFQASLFRPVSVFRPQCLDVVFRTHS